MTHFLFQTLVGRTIVAYVMAFSVPFLITFLFLKLVGLMGLRDLFTYEAKDTIIHRLDPRLKVLYPATVSTLSVFLNWNWVYALFAFTLIPWILLRPSRNRLRVLLTMTVVPALGAIWSQGMFYTTPNHPFLFQFPWTMYWVGSPGVTLYGMQYGAQEAGRGLVSVSSSLLLILTTEPSEIIWAFMKMKTPPKFGLALSAALRFLPQMFEQMTILLQAIEVRGYNFTRPKRWWHLGAWLDYLKRVMTAIPLVTTPLLINSLRQTSLTAMVADARGFGAHKQRTIYRKHLTGTNDIIAWGLYGCVICVTLALVVSGIAIRHAYT